MERRELSFESGGLSCVGWLSRPAGAARPPVVVMAHGFSALGDFTPAFSERFAAAGLATLSFDYRHFGRSDGQPRQLLDVSRQLEDLAAAVRHVRARDDVDGERVGLWGSSFGGAHVIVYAARDERIRAVVAQSPFVDGLAALRSVGPLQALRLSGAGLQDQLARLAGRAPRCVAVVGPPGALAAITTPGAEPLLLGLVPPGSPLAEPRLRPDRAHAAALPPDPLRRPGTLPAARLRRRPRRRQPPRRRTRRRRSRPPRRAPHAPGRPPRRLLRAAARARLRRPSRLLARHLLNAR